MASSSTTPDTALTLKSYDEMLEQKITTAVKKAPSMRQMLPNGKKTKGRVKIKMEYIGNKLRRYTTFSKRKTGIMKKAHELATLTGTQVLLLVASETGHVYAFATGKLKPLIASERGKEMIQGCLSSADENNIETTEAGGEAVAVRTEFTFEPGNLLPSASPQATPSSSRSTGGRKRKLPPDQRRVGELGSSPTMVSSSERGQMNISENNGALHEEESEEEDEDEEGEAPSEIGDGSSHQTISPNAHDPSAIHPLDLGDTLQLLLASYSKAVLDCGNGNAPAVAASTMNPSSGAAALKEVEQRKMKRARKPAKASVCNRTTDPNTLEPRKKALKEAMEAAAHHRKRAQTGKTQLSTPTDNHPAATFPPTLASRALSNSERATTTSSCPVNTNVLYQMPQGVVYAAPTGMQADASSSRLESYGITAGKDSANPLIAAALGVLFNATRGIGPGSTNSLLFPPAADINSMSTLQHLFSSTGLCSPALSNVTVQQLFAIAALSQLTSTNPPAEGCSSSSVSSTPSSGAKG